MTEIDRMREVVSELCTGMFSDALDELGCRNQVVNLRIGNHPVATFLGPARTVALEDADDGDERINVGLGFLAECRAGDVLVVQGSREFAYFGELMTAISLRVRLSGVVIDGLTRDKNATWQSGLPVAAAGYSPKDIKGRGRVAHVDAPIVVGGVPVGPNDLIFCDSDGAVVTPAHLIPQTADKVLAAVREEREIKKAIREGASVEQILRRHRSF